MVKRIRWSPRAAENLEQIFRYIALDSRHYATLFTKRILRIVSEISRFPEAGRVVPEYDEPSLRERIYRNYRIVYRIKGDFVEVVAICHSAKPLENL
jgi:plasmid stabilization system protein ParE